MAWDVKIYLKPISLGAGHQTRGGRVLWRSFVGSNPFGDLLEEERGL
jgi:hypothetical protein